MAVGVGSGDHFVAQLAHDFARFVAEHPLGGLGPGPDALLVVRDEHPLRRHDLPGPGFIQAQKEILAEGRFPGCHRLLLGFFEAVADPSDGGRRGRTGLVEL